MSVIVATLGICASSLILTLHEGINDRSEILEDVIRHDMRGAWAGVRLLSSHSSLDSLFSLLSTQLGLRRSSNSFILDSYLSSIFHEVKCEDIARQFISQYHENKKFEESQR